MKIFLCDECGKEKSRSNANILSCSIIRSNFKYIVTMKTTKYSSHNKNIYYPHLELCFDCIKSYRSSLQDDDVKRIMSYELLSLASGKAKRLEICKALEEGNGK